ncbi:NADH-quinone oxidoreductase subunit M [Helicobacter pylori]|uniref:NADH-quinone oxidoreductase subunit M n=1 Tax=Helicobacter pylori TaxID=210 RepID=UPI00165C227B|nr:NADH-quinone oxidoreductase subunit M [Helicobacter pylori]MBH0259179.1 NADH-quinone oxidoreductase subunit M [Helicobacter pylori]MBH0263744.1 NADH-quinone oxidoreductase subunit M [Helicobacter pylori]
MQFLHAHLLSVVIFFPMLSALLAFFMSDQASRAYAIVIALIELLLILLLWHGFDIQTAGMQFEETKELVYQIGVNYHVGVDGIALFLLLLNAIVVLLSVIYVKERRKDFAICLLLLEGILMGVFSSLNMIFFYAFWEISLLPVLYLIGRFGRNNKIYSSMKFFLYTFLASLCMLLGILYIGYEYANNYGMMSFDILDWYQLNFSSGVKTWLFVAFLIGIAVKIPLFPLHTWLPYAYSNAPTLGSVMLSALLSKMGTYALLRFLLPLFPELSEIYLTPIAIVALCMIIYGGFLAYAQKDLKTLIAYSSFSHMGVVVLGVFSFNVEGVSGAVFMMFAHGIIVMGLFLLAGILEERASSLEIARFGSIAKSAPIFAAFFMIVLMANVGMPLSIGFVGEFLSLLGFFATYPLLAIIAGTSIILSAIYMLTSYKDVFFGNLKAGNNQISVFDDLNAREVGVLGVILALILILGIYPKILLKPIEQGSKQLLEVIEIRSLPFLGSLDTKIKEVSYVNR